MSHTVRTCCHQQGECPGGQFLLRLWSFRFPELTWPFCDLPGELGPQCLPTVHC